MSIHLNPGYSAPRAHQHSQPQGCGHRCHRPHQHRAHSASTLTIPNKSSSCLNRLKQWVTSIFSWIKNLFPHKPPAPLPNPVVLAKPPAPVPNPVVSSIGAPSISHVVSSASGDLKPFAKHDLDYQGYSQADTRELLFAENCCAYPKLALYLGKQHRINIHSATQRINIACKKEPNATSMTAQFVLQNSPA